VNGGATPTARIARSKVDCPVAPLDEATDILA
jgi:hypothetical protein